MEPSTVGSFVLFVLILGTLIFVHEFGHFITSKRLGVPVEEFGFGFPPRVVGVVRGADGRWRVVWGPRNPPPAEIAPGATIYSFNAIPLGGFVRPAGEDDPRVPGGLASAPKRVRLAVLSAGSIFNLVFAFVVFFVGFRLGWPDRVAIADVNAGSPAATAGLEAEDLIVTAAGKEIHYPAQMSEVTYSHLGKPFELTVERAGQARTFTVTPRSDWPQGEGPLGILMRSDMVTTYSVPQAAARSVQEMWMQFEALIHLPGRLLRQEVTLEEARPISIVGLNDLTRVAVDAAQQTNQLYPIIQLVGLISVALGITNLLPIPALDGGRILFVLIEALRGRRLDPARENMVHVMGMLALLAFMVVIIYQDLVNPLFR